jgi:hypothetical protein
MLEEACAEAGVAARVRRRAASSVGRGLHELAEITAADLWHRLDTAAMCRR